MNESRNEEKTTGRKEGRKEGRKDRVILWLDGGRQKSGWKDT